MYDINFVESMQEVKMKTDCVKVKSNFLANFLKELKQLGLKIGKDFFVLGEGEVRYVHIIREAI